MTNNITNIVGVWIGIILSFLMILYLIKYMISGAKSQNTTKKSSKKTEELSEEIKDDEEKQLRELQKIVTNRVRKLPRYPKQIFNLDIEFTGIKEKYTFFSLCSAFVVELSKLMTYQMNDKFANELKNKSSYDPNKDIRLFIQTMANVKFSQNHSNTQRLTIDNNKKNEDLVNKIIQAFGVRGWSFKYFLEMAANLGMYKQVVLYMTSGKTTPILFIDVCQMLTNLYNYDDLALKDINLGFFKEKEFKENLPMINAWNHFVHGPVALLTTSMFTYTEKYRELTSKFMDDYDEKMQYFIAKSDHESKVEPSTKVYNFNSFQKFNIKMYLDNRTLWTQEITLINVDNQPKPVSTITFENACQNLISNLYDKRYGKEIIWIIIIEKIINDGDDPIQKIIEEMSSIHSPYAKYKVRDDSLKQIVQQIESQFKYQKHLLPFLLNIGIYNVEFKNKNDNEWPSWNELCAQVNKNNINQITNDSFVREFHLDERIVRKKKIYRENWYHYMHQHYNQKSLGQLMMNYHQSYGIVV